MSAGILRRAASLMRERAEAATPGPWVLGISADGTPQVNSEPLMTKAFEHVDVTTPAVMNGDGEHIASWHPVVALAVADWLDRSADWLDRHPANATPDAIAVARAYLGSDA